MRTLLWKDMKRSVFLIAEAEVEMASLLQIVRFSIKVVARAAAAVFLVSSSPLSAAIVVGHDINTLGTLVAGPQETAFAVNVATFLTSGRATRNLLLFESDPGDGARDFSSSVLAALGAAGFGVTVTADYTTPFAGFDAIFVAEDFPTVGFLNNASLTNYANGGGGVYLAGGAGPSASAEAAGWSLFLNHYGLAFESSGYNGLASVPVTSTHPIFAGITALESGSGQSIIDLGSNPNAHIVQFASNQGVYAVVDVPEPATLTLIGIGALLLAYRFRRRQ